MTSGTLCITLQDRRTGKVQDRLDIKADFHPYTEQSTRVEQFLFGLAGKKVVGATRDNNNYKLIVE